MHARPPSTTRRPLLLLGAAAAVLALAAVGGCAAKRLSTAAELARRSEPFQARPPAPAQRLLVVGDSTAAGTGASSPAASLAGLIAREHPRLAVDNRSTDGARFADVAEQLARADARYDVVLVQAGGNDVIRLTADDTLRAGIERTLAAAHARAPRVLLMPAGNVGNAPFFAPPISWWMTHRARRMHGMVRVAAAGRGTTLIDLFRERDADPFVATPSLNAADGLHPSDAGYARWWHELRAQTDIEALLAASR